MQGKVIIFSAPSGAGKTTVVKHILGLYHELEFSVSATSRPPREGETNGKDYFFISTDEFRQKIGNDEFVEFEEVYPGRFYGTLKSELERIWKKGGQVVFDVDVKGGLNLKKIFGSSALAVFISPPDLETLKLRLEKRGTDSPENIDIRVKKAGEEMEYAGHFDTILYNDKIEKTLSAAESLVADFLRKK
jgi:guanylate kinase